MTGEEVLATSFSSTAALAGSQRFVMAGKNALKMFGLAMAKEVNASDRPGLFVPLRLQRRDKPAPAALLALSDRLVVAWTEGILRPKASAVTLRHETITQWYEGSQPGTRLQVASPTLTVRTSGGDWLFVHDNIYRPGGPNLPRMLSSAVSGGILFSSPSDDAVQQPANTAPGHANTEAVSATDGSQGEAQGSTDRHCPNPSCDAFMLPTKFTVCDVCRRSTATSSTSEPKKRARSRPTAPAASSPLGGRHCANPRCDAFMLSTTFSVCDVCRQETQA